MNTRRQKDPFGLDPDSDHVARGAISNVLAKARATLKDPSRPFTPLESRQSSRAMFGGIDQRPSTRPGSSRGPSGGDLGMGTESSPLTRRCRQSSGSRQSTGNSMSSVPRSREGKPPPAASWGWNQGEDTTPRHSGHKTRRYPSGSGPNSEEEMSGTDSGPGPWEEKFEDTLGPDFAEMDEILQQMDVKLAAIISSDVLQEEKQYLESKGEGRADQYQSLNNLLAQLWVHVDSLCVARTNRPHDYQLKRQYGRIFHTLLRVLRCHDPMSQLTASRAGLKLVTATPDFSHPPRQQNEHDDNPPRNLFYITKAVYQISRTLENDELFVNSKIVDSLMELCEESSKEIKKSIKLEENGENLINRKSGMGTFLSSLVYSIGALKNCSTSEKVQSGLCNQGAVKSMHQMIKQTMKLCEVMEKSQKNENEERVLKVLAQITGLLRNLSLQKAHLKKFVGSGILTALCSLLAGTYTDNQELSLNISRVLSKLSLHDVVRKEIYKDPNHIKNLVHILDRDEDKLDFRQGQISALIVRVAFVLGNLTATNDGNRKMIGQRFRGVDIMLSLLSSIGEHYIYSLGREHGRGKVGGEEGVADTLVKLCRLVANLAINKDVGEQIARHEGAAVVSPLLQTCVAFPGNGSEEGLIQEELLLNVVSLVANLSYYGSASSRLGTSAIHETRFEIIKELTQVLFHENEEAVSEAVRTFGNLSRDSESRQKMKDLKTNDALVLLLDHSNKEVVYSSAGVLMNLASDINMKECLGFESTEEMGDYGAGRLLKILRRAGLNDTDMSIVSCQALCNLLTGCAAEEICNLMYEDDIELLHDTLDELVETAEETLEEEQEEKNQNNGYTEFLSAAGALKGVLSTCEKLQGTNIADAFSLYEELETDFQSK